MQLSAKMMREQLARMKPMLTNCSLGTTRKGQNAVGELMRGVVYGERIEPHCELNPADTVQEAADDDVLAASEKLLQRNAYVYEELAK